MSLKGDGLVFHTNGTGTQRQGKIQILVFLQTIHHQARVLHGECLYIVYRNKFFIACFKFIYSLNNLMKQGPRFLEMTSDSEIMKMFVTSWKPTDLKLLEMLSVKDVFWLDKYILVKWNSEDYQVCPDLTIKTGVEMLLLMLFITEIKLPVLKLGNIAKVKLGACHKCDFRPAWSFQLLRSVLTVFLIL